MIPSLKVLKVIAPILLVISISISVNAAESVPKRTLLALSKANHTLAVVDPATLKVISYTPVGPDRIGTITTLMRPEIKDRAGAIVGVELNPGNGSVARFEQHSANTLL